MAKLKIGEKKSQENIRVLFKIEKPNKKEDNLFMMCYFYECFRSGINFVWCLLFNIV